jgi:predicted nucleic acid-binding protein
VSATPLVVVAADANLLINLIHTGRLGLLGVLPGHRFVVPDAVVAEIKSDDQPVHLSNAISNGTVSVAILTDPIGLTLFGQLRVSMGLGESACLALAVLNSWSVASDERRAFRRAVLDRLGPSRLLTTPDIYVLAIKSGAISVADADSDMAVLASHRFVIKGFTSYDRLI